MRILENFKTSWVCWGLVFVWLVPVLVLNFPFEPPWHLSSNARFHFGFPFLFAHYQQLPDRSIARTYDGLMMLIDLVMILSNQAALLFLLNRYFQKFSIRTLLVSVTLVAFLTMAIQYALETMTKKEYAPMLSIAYFSPCVVLLLMTMVKGFVATVRGLLRAPALASDEVQQS